MVHARGCGLLRWMLVSRSLLGSALGITSSVRRKRKRTEQKESWPWGRLNTGNSEAGEGARPLFLHINQSLDVGNLGRGCSHRWDDTVPLKQLWWGLKARASCQKPFRQLGEKSFSPEGSSERKRHIPAWHFYHLQKSAKPILANFDANSSSSSNWPKKVLNKCWKN